MINTSTLPLSVNDARRLVAAELSSKARSGHVVGLLFAIAMTIVTASLFLTEPDIPARTRWAFALLAGIGTAWSVYFGWVLSTRRILLAAHRIVAGRMATLFSSLFTAAALTLAALEPARREMGLLAGALGLVMVAAAVAVLVHAHSKHRELLRLRAVLLEQAQSA